MRQDIPVNHQCVQAIHAAYQMAVYYRPDESIPNVVYIGVPDIAALKRVLMKLSANHIPHYAYEEPDNDFGLTAIATVPIFGEQRNCLRNYRTYQFTNAPLAQDQSAVIQQ